MRTIFWKIAVFFGLKPAKQVAMDKMMEMKEREDYFDDIETMPGKMELVPVRIERRQRQGPTNDM